MTTSTLSTRFSTVAHALPETTALPAGSQTLADRLTALYALSQRSNYVFGSPLGPFHHRSRHLHLPRFVYFGPHTHDESLRLSFTSGFDSTDLRGSLAIVHFVERLALTPDLGLGLNLSFFPLVDAAGFFHGETARSLEQASWRDSPAPELDLLQKDARVRGYHGFVRVETAPGADVVTARLRGHTDSAVSVSGVELISSEDFEPLPVRWEADPAEGRVSDGPLTLVDDLPFRAFELILRIPAAWSADLYREAVASILKRFILRYRTLQAYGQNL